MKKIPDIISTKDLSYLEDMFNWHITLAKKAEFYKNYVEDKEILNQLSDVESKHKSICQDIVNIIEKENV